MKSMADALPVTPMAPCPGNMESAAATSTWRLAKPVQIPGRCALCLNCILFCPDSARREEEGEIRINYRVCKGCGICANECPSRAIAMEEEN